MDKKYEIKWDKSLNTGIPWIDEQHKKLLETVCTLLNVVVADEGYDETGKALRFVLDYTKSHFGTEEQFMIKYEYPGYQEHIQEHAKFIAKMNKFEEFRKASGATHGIAKKLTYELWDWYKHHIKEVDKNFGMFLKINGKV